MKRVLVAGATGYLGRFVLKELKQQGYQVRALARSSAKLKTIADCVDEEFIGEATIADSLAGICKNMNVVFSSIGITKQKDGFSYMDVDYQANINLLEEAKRNKVTKFIYVSVLNGDKLRNLKICEAKEKFVDELKKSGLEYSIIRPNGFFSDMTEFYKMAQNGRIHLFGNGKQKSNPVHGEDLAKVCVSAINSGDKEIEAGGPETLTQNDIAKLAFDAVGRKPQIVHLPNWVRLVTLKIAKMFMNSKSFGPVEFFLNVMAMDMVAPEYGKRTLQNYFIELNDSK